MALHTSTYEIHFVDSSPNVFLSSNNVCHEVLGSALDGTFPWLTFTSNHYVGIAGIEVFSHWEVSIEWDDEIEGDLRDKFQMFYALFGLNRYIKVTALTIVPS